MGGVVRAKVVRWEGLWLWCWVKVVLDGVFESGKYGELREREDREVVVLFVVVDAADWLLAVAEESFGSWRRPAAAQFVPPERNVIRIDF